MTKDNFTYTTGELNLSGNTLNITKNMTQSGGKIDLNGGTINIGQNLTQDNAQLDLNGGNISVGKDLTQNRGDFDLHGGKLKVERNMLQNGTMYINGGELDIDGDYYIAGKREIEDDGTETVGSGSGYLKMVKNADKVKVGNDFQMNTNVDHSNYLTAGTMYVGGDFKQKYSYSYSRYNFKATGSHTVILNGEDVQNVSFESAESKFNNLYLTKEKDTGYTFSPDNCWTTLYLNTNVSEVQISPADISLEKGDSLQLKAKVLGINKPSQKVEWSMDGAQSEETGISESGLLKIALKENAQTLTVKAVSTEDNSKFAVVTVKVLPATVTVDQVKIKPNVSSIFAGEEQQFYAKVSGTNEPSQEVKWSLSGNKSSDTTISADGMLTVGADETAETLKVTDTSAFDTTKSASATVEVVTVEISSTVENVVVSLKQGTITRFYAKVLGTNNPSQSVIWSLEGNVSKDTVITEDGELTIAKDETAETLVVTAVSAENHEKSGVLAFHVLENDTTPQTPEKPEAEEITSASVRLAYTAGYEYSLDAKNWQDDPFFDGLESNAEYTFFQRVKETAVNYASETSEGLTIATLAEKDNHEHTFGDPIFAWSEDGKSCTVTFVCAENPEHTESYETSVSDTVKVRATCSQMGTTEYKAVYGAYSSTKEIQDIPLDAENHAGGTEIRNAKEATCEEEGYTGDICCKNCGEILQNGTGIEKKEHTWNQGEVVKEATCTEDGERKYTCTICKMTKTEAISATGHERSEEVRNQKEATCEEEGYTGDICCKKCGEILQRGTVTDKKEHIWDQGEIVKEATCTQDGERKYTCTLCQKTRTEVIASTGHSFGVYKIIKEATNLEDGLQSRTCNICGKTEYQIIPKVVSSVTIPDQKPQDRDNSKLNQNQQQQTTVKTTQKITLNRKKLTLKKGKSFKLKVTLTPKDSKDKIVYKTSNKKIATVSKNGKIKARKKGTVKITVISGKKKAVCKVKVK